MLTIYYVQHVFTPAAQVIEKFEAFMSLSADLKVGSLLAKIGHATAVTTSIVVAIILICG